MDFSAASKSCSFCGVQGGRDHPLGGGLGAMICKTCVDRYHDEMSGDIEALRGRPPWESMTDTELLAQLPLILRSAEQNATFAHEWVALIRARRISWAAIGSVLGVSRQAAWERFAGKQPKAHDASA